MTCFIVYVLQFIIAVNTKKYNKSCVSEEDITEEGSEFDTNDYANWEKPQSSDITYSIAAKLPSTKAICLKIGNVFMILIGIISTVNMFRGYWFLLDEYFMPTNYESSLIHGQIYGALILMISFAGCSLHAGVFRDEHVGAKCLVDFYYMSYFYAKVKIQFYSVY